MKNITTYLKKNWKSVAFILVIAGLLLFNVKQYQASQAIVRENQKINLQYQAMLEREIIYNQQIAEYRTQISKKDSAIAVEKNKISQTEAQLQVSQGEARRLSARIKTLSTNNQEELQAYVQTCDSLSVVAPVLADQVDSLKKDNKALVTTMEEKSVLQDSIIKKKDVIISENKTLLANTVESYNKATDKLVLVENKYNKEKARKSFWKKTTIVLGLVIGGIFATK
jgi:hypothetical protein